MDRKQPKGNMNSVEFVGDTVRRSAGPWTPSVHRLLAHARGRGIAWAPEPLGYDQAGREVLSFIPGEVPHAMPPWVWSEDVLIDVAGALRQWHDATSDFDGKGAVWRLDAREPGEVICHNDFAPYNCAFRDGRFAGAFDFDTCSPGPRLWDIAYTAYRFVPLMPPLDTDVPDGRQERSPFPDAELRGRLDLFLDAYAKGDAGLRYRREAVFEAAENRLETLAAWTDSHAAKTGDASLAKHGRMYRAHAQWISRLPVLP